MFLRSLRITRYCATAVLIALLLAAAACSRPSGYKRIGNDTLEDLFTELYLAEALIKVQGAGIDADSLRLRARASVFRKYRVTQTDWDSTLYHLSSDRLNLLAKITQRAADRIEAYQKQYPDTIIAELQGNGALATYLADAFADSLSLYDPTTAYLMKVPGEPLSLSVPIPFTYPQPAQLHISGSLHTLHPQAYSANLLIALQLTDSRGTVSAYTSADLPVTGGLFDLSLPIDRLDTTQTLQATLYGYLLEAPQDGSPIPVRLDDMRLFLSRPPLSEAEVSALLLQRLPKVKI